MRSSTSSGRLRFEATILEVGPLPPSDGPNRQRYLDVNGRRALTAAGDAFAAAMATMGARADSIPTMSTPLIEDDGKTRVAIQRKKHAEWIEFTSTLDPELLNQIEPHIRQAEVSAVTSLNFLRITNWQKLLTRPSTERPLFDAVCSAVPSFSVIMRCGLIARSSCLTFE